MTANLDLTIEKNVTFFQSFNWYTSYASGGGVPVDIVGCSVKMQIRPSSDSQELYLDLTDKHISIGDGAQGEIIINIEAEVTKTLNFSVGVYDIIVERPTGEVSKILEGLVYLTQTTTRDEVVV